MSTNVSTGNGSGQGGGYKCSHRGLILPLIDESSWSDSARAILYFVALIYSFFGISIAADVFMCAIERITSQTRTVKERHPEFGSVDDLGEAGLGKSASNVREVRVWNPTVANLTLMALGSSMPEILLTAIEIIGRNFEPGELGPSTVVGSAAFNLLVITAICISAIPHPETRRLSEIMVFSITSISSILAYIWLLIILKVITPNEVGVWEALITLIFFIIMVITAYIADKKFWYRWSPKGKKVDILVLPKQDYHLKMGAAELKGTKKESQETAKEDAQEALNSLPTKEDVEQVDTVPLDQVSVSRPLTTKSILSKRGARPETSRSLGAGSNWLQIQRKVAKKYPDASAEKVARLAAEEIDAGRTHSLLYYRIAAARRFAASGNMPKRSRDQDEYSSRTQHWPVVGISKYSQLAVDPSKLLIIQFAANKYAASENDSQVTLKVVRENRTNKRVLFKYETLDGSAKRGKDYVSRSETLVFNPGESEKFINIQILKDREKEPDEMFYVKLSLEDFADGRTMIGQNNVAMVTIIDNDKDTKIQFPQNSMAVKENVGTVHIPVTRRGGTKHQATIEWQTISGTAVDRKDFIGGSGVLEFEVGEIEKHISIPIIDDKELEKHESFEVVLSNPSEGSSLSSKKKRCIITILNDDETTLLLTQSDKLVLKQLEALQPGAQSWRQQFIRAANVNGGDIEKASAIDYLLHLISFGWKLLFAFVPPPTIGGGWPTFVIALVLIGLLTTVVGDLASIFGCLVNLKQPVTAITVVAVGTSLPDLFASRWAAVHEKTADNAVGNITGSNSVNVFLGLGVSWFIGAVYWWRRGGTFKVPAGDLCFSVTIYIVVALLCLGLLVLRRNVGWVFGGGELGGPRLAKWLSSGFLVLLWVVYVLLSSLQVYGHLPGF